MNKIFKKISRITSKLNHDFKNYHVFSLQKNLLNKFSFKKNNKVKFSDKFISRITAYANFLKENEPPQNKNDLWSVLGKEINHSSFIETACNAKHNKNKFIKFIMNFGKSNSLHGFGPNIYTYSRLIKNKYYRTKEKFYFLDYLTSLSEYYGNTKVYNPQQGGWMVEKEDFDKLIKKIFKPNVKIFKTPDYYYGYKFNNKFLFSMDLKAMHSAERLASVYKHNNLSEVVEIGGGAGYASHYFTQQIKTKYTIYDLPYASILQAIHLAQSLGENYLHLENEKKINKNCIYIKPYWKIFHHKTKNNILWFNEDSMTEINHNLVKKYVEKILKSKKSMFLSINQEAINDYGLGIKQHKVRNFMKKSNIIYRSRDFLRPGYIEELYKID